jgi:hypothetical protein
MRSPRQSHASRMNSRSSKVRCVRSTCRLHPAPAFILPFALVTVALPHMALPEIELSLLDDDHVAVPDDIVVSLPISGLTGGVGLDHRPQPRDSARSGVEGRR